MRSRSLAALISGALVLVLAQSPAFAQERPLTVAEATQWRATSRYADVMAFIARLQRLSPHIRVETLCTSAEGRAVPLLVIGRPLPALPQALANDPRMTVYIQGNIHAGEVEGKEATLMLARDILLDEKMGGTIHLAIGRSYPESGGKNDSAIHWDMIKDLRTQGELFLDGKPVLRTGVLFGKTPNGIKKRST